MHNRLEPAVWIGLTAVLLWSTVATAFKLALAQLSVLQLLWLACLTSCCCLFSLLMWQRRVSELVRSLRRYWPRHLVLALINPTCYYLVLFGAYARLPAQLAQPINYSWAIMLSLLAVPFRGHRLSRIQLLALFVGYTGVAIIASRGQWHWTVGTDTWGLILALFSTVLWALYCLFNSKQQEAPLVVVCAQFFLAFPVITLLMLVLEPLSGLTWQGVVAGIYVGIFEMGITFVIWLRALQLTHNTARISQLIFLSPFLSLVLIHFILGEIIHTATLVGLVFILVGVIIQQRFSSIERLA